MKQIAFLIIIFLSIKGYCQSVDARPELRLTVKAVGWHQVGGKRCMQLKASIKNISGHRITYVKSNFPRHMFCIDTTTISLYLSPYADGGSHFEFPSITVGSSVQFPVDVFLVNDITSRVKFRLGFIWTMSNAQSEIAFKIAASKNEIKQKVFWSDTLTLVRD